MGPRTTDRSRRKRRPGLFAATATALLVGLAVAACGAESGSAGSTAKPRAGQAGATPAAAAEGAQPPLGEGLLVWESNRTGEWRIWKRALEGSPPRRLSPDEPGRSHCCPHISPDGTRIVYLSTAGRAGRYEEETVGELHLVRSDGAGDRIVASNAHTYFENRVAVWRSPDELLYIAGDRTTWLLDLASGKSRQLVREPPPSRGWLLDATLSYATTGEASFSPYDARRLSIAGRSAVAGCQPYFSHDGRWGFWTAGAGGPLARMDLATRQVSTLLAKNDPRMHDGWGYAYFPMLSRDGRLFAYAASRGDHDHFKSDYEVFVAETDPDTLEVLGPVVRMTNHPGTDRYPDVFPAPLALGRHAGEAPFVVRFEPAGAAARRWALGDGTQATGPAAEHAYTSPGRYEVSARTGGEELRGLVVVEPAAPPRPVEVGLEENGSRAIVRFDEPVALGEAVVRFESGHAVKSRSAGADGRSLVLELAEPLTRPDRLILEGVLDRAQRPNRLASTSVDVEPPLWPSRPEGLAFLWQTGDAANLVYDPALEADHAFTLEASGLARLDHDYAMALGGGAYYLEAESAAPVRFAVQGTNEISLEATIRPTGKPLPETHVVSFANRSRGQNFRLLERRGRLSLSLRIAPRSSPELALFELPRDHASHVVVTYTPGRLTAYLDGELRLDSDALQGDFFAWRNYPLVLGDEWGGGADWHGTLEGLAIYSRVLGADEVRENHLRYRALLAERQPVDRLLVEARLKARSRPPTLQEISPYQEALVIFDYEIERVLEGQVRGGPAARRLRVAHWALLDGKPAPAGRATEGQLLRLELEPFKANPQLEGLYLADTLEPAAGVPLYYAPDPAPPSAH